MRKQAFVTGAGGQDGSYLCEKLLAEGYEVSGLIRPSGDGRRYRLANCINSPYFKLVYGDIIDPAFPHILASKTWDEVYLLAAQTHVMQSYHAPTVAMETNAMATTRILDALFRTSPKTRVYFAATSEMFGTMQPGEKADENYQLAAQSPYAAAKVASHLLCRVYREKGFHVSSGISFNHESCRRGAEFVTRKIGLNIRNRGKVTLGNIDSCRDWHHAQDTVEGMWRALQMPTGDEYVFASGVARSVRDLAEAVCDYFDTPYKDAISVAESEKRPWDVDYLCGDASKAETILGWKPQISWDDLVANICSPEGMI